MTDSTIADTTSVVSVQSSVSTRSSRSGLTRQGNHKHKYLMLQHLGMHNHKMTDEIITHGVQLEFSFNESKKPVFLFLSFLCLPRIDIQALELWKEVRKGKGKEKTQEDCCGYPTACSDGTGYVLLKRCPATRIS